MSRGFVLAFFVLLSFSTTVSAQTLEGPSCNYEAQEGRTIIYFDESKIYSSRSEDEAKIGPIAVDIPAGKYNVSLVAYDGDHDRDEKAPQSDEIYKVILENGCGVVAETNATEDLLDSVLEATYDGVVNTDFILGEDITKITAFQVAYYDNTTANSVVPVCAVFDLIPEEEPTYQCSDGIDNDGDGYIDQDDHGCQTTPGDPSTYDPNDDNETYTAPVPEPECGDGTCDSNESCSSCPADCD